MAMSFILDGLFLGSMDDVYASKKLRENGINHVLTLETRPIPREFAKGLNVKFVHAFDMDNQDLLSQFDECFKFIDQGRQSGAVLVHCFVGQSRSSTIIIAYLMQKLDMTLHDAMTMVTKLRPQIRPNPGFQKQLELFEAMGNVVNKANMDYKLYKLNNLADRMQEAQLLSGVPEDMLAADPLHSKSGHGEGFYKCRKCRRPLFKACAILSHLTGRGGAAFDWRAKLSTQELGLDDQEQDTCKQSLFIEPVQWMNSYVMQQTGKLSCPKCNAKLGSFSWFGENCPCGSWVVPAFHVQPSKVDECKPRVQPPSRITCRKPPQLPMLNTAGPGTQGDGKPTDLPNLKENSESSIVKDFSDLKT